MRIFRYVKKHWFWMVLAPLFMIGEVLMDVIQPDLMSKIVDEGLTNNNLELVITTGIEMLVLVLFGGLMGILSGVCANNGAIRYSNDLRKDLFVHINDLSFQQVDIFSTGSLVTRVTNDVSQVQQVVAMSTRMLFRTLMQFIFGTIFLLRIDKRFGYILLIMLPILLCIMILFLIKVSPSFKIMQERVDDINAIVQENVSGARVVKAYTAENKEMKRFGGANQRLYDVNWNVGKKLAFISPLFNLIINAAALIIMYIGGVSIAKNYDICDATNTLNDEVNALTNGIQVGDIIAAINYLVILASGFIMLALMFSMFVRGAASIKRLNEVLDTKPVVEEKEETVDGEGGTIEFKNVSFQYPGSKTEIILNDISFSINKGEKVGVLGSTGSGKSSLVNLIARFYDTTSGDVLVDGINVKDYSFKTLRDKVAMVLQKSELFTDTIANNIRWGKKDADFDEVVHAAKIAQADDFINSFEDKYDTMIEEKGSSLSGGQKQRISIARAIIKKPEIMIFDDSTSALDLATEAKLYEAIRKELSSMTVVTIAQRVASVVNCDKIIVLNDGHIDAVGTHKELLETCETYQDIYNSQLKRGGEIDG